MEANRDEIKVLYIDDDNYYHEILLNSLELKRIVMDIIQIFSAKKMDVMVSAKKLKLLEEVRDNGTENSGKVQ